VTGERVAVLGGNGKTGRAVARALSGTGVDPVALGRAAWSDLGGSLAGCSAVYAIAPNLHPDEPEYVADALAAARSVGVSRVVYHSVTAPFAPSMPHHLGKAKAEDLVRRSSLSWTVLQPCAYVQNFPPMLTSGQDVLEVPYDVTQVFGLIDLADVAEAAATVLLDDGHAGATYELGGPALVTPTDVADAAAAVLGRVVTATRVTAGQGVHPWLRAMFAYYDAHGLPAGPVPVTALLGRPPRTLEETLQRELR
jgi:uncharacterized protein YbjT (DUF2867 family)